MTTSFIGAASAEATSVTLPAHQAGDLILLFAWNGGSLTVPTVPSGWLVIYAIARSTGANRAWVLAWKVATSSSETSGTWTNAAIIGTAVYRHSTNYLVVGGTNVNQDLNSTAFAYPSLPAYTNGTNTGGKMRSSTSWHVGIAGANLNTQSLETAPSGMSFRNGLAGASANEIAFHDTGANSSSYAGATVTMSLTTVGAASVVELLDTGIAKSSASFRPVNIRGGADQ
jgi:hypothetical protein